MRQALPVAVPASDAWQGRVPWHWLCACLGLVLYVPLLWGMDRWVLGVAASAYRTPAAMLLNAAVAVPFVLVLWSLSRRLLSSLLLVLLLQVLLYKVSAVKLQVLGAPLALQDFYFLTSFNRASLELLGSYLEDAAAVWAWTGGGALLLALAFWAERPWMGRARLARVVVFGAGAALVAALYLAAWPWTAFYTRDAVRPSPLGPGPGALHAGLMSSLVFKHLDLSNAVHAVDEAALRALLEATAEERAGIVPAQAGAEALPDIVVILSESFMDPRILAGMDQVADPIPATRALLERGAGGPMRVPTYGGGTVRTEFEVLTGMPVSAFPSVMYPYVDMARPRMPGLPALLRDLGYATVAVHGNSGAFWNRTDTFRAMGIQRFLTEKAFRGQGVRDGVWYSDASMTDLVLQELEAADAPLFVAAISIENHGPYESEAPVRDAAAKEAVPVPDVLPARAAGSLRNYLYHLGNADRELERLLRRMEQRGRPFVVVFFGDHLPALPEVYNTLQFADGGQAEEQMVPWLVVGDGGRRAGARPLHSWELAAEALEVAGLAGDPYFDLVRVAGRRLAALPPDSPEADELRRGVEAAAVARMQGRFEEFLR